MKNTKKLILSALFLALSFVLPFLTGQIPKIGAMLCPLHIPVLLCGFLCGWPYGAAVGFIAPLFRSLIFGMPPFLSALAMAFELAAYGALSGMMHSALPKKKPYIYISLLTAMVGGRLVWGAATFIILGSTGGTFTFSAFLLGAVLNALPGIIIQIVLVPLLVMALDTPKALNLKD